MAAKNKYKKPETENTNGALGNDSVPNYAIYYKRIALAAGTKGFEIDATYSSGGTLQQMTVKQGFVFIGHKVYTTKPVTFTRDNFAVYLCAQKERRKGSDAKPKWKVWVTDDPTEKNNENKEIFDSFSFILFAIQDGTLVYDNRYLLCLSRKHRKIPGEIHYELEPCVGTSKEISCQCQDLYVRLKGLKVDIENQIERATEFLDQIPEE